MKCIFYAIGSSYLFDVQETIERLGWQVEAYVANRPDLTPPNAVSPVVSPAELKAEWLKLPVVFPLITPGYRQQLYAEAKELGFKEFASVIDPTSVLARRSSFGEGALINAGVVVAANVHAGKFVVLNRSVSIGHNVSLGDFVTVGPGVTICGGCTIRSGAFIGAGSTITPDITIGRNAVIGAGAVVNSDVPDNCMAVGVPAKTVKQNIRGYNEAPVLC